MKLYPAPAFAFSLALVIVTSSCAAPATTATGSPTVSPARVLAVPGLICFWTFQEPAGRDRVALGPHRYRLHEAGGEIPRTDRGIFGRYSAELQQGRWFKIPRAECPALDLHGTDAQVTVVAWLQRHAKGRPTECEAVAGLWNETRSHRQYCLFLNLRIWGSAHQVCGHVSSTGGPSAGYRYCMEASIGATPVPFDRWQCVGFTYNGREARSYLNGQLDRRPGRNPYPCPGGIFEGGPDGAAFTVGAVNRSGEMGNWFVGRLGGLAVFDRALTAAEMRALAAP